MAGGVMAESGAGRVLIIDDERNLRESLAEFLALDGYDCVGAGSGEEGLDRLSRESFDAALLDLRMPGIDGLETLVRIRDGGPGIPVVMMSAHGEIGDAVEAMKRGATDYLVKPFDPAELSIRLAKAIADDRLIRLARIGERLAEPSVPDTGSVGWLGDDPSMSAVGSLVRRVAPTNSTVLITGESGTGKEVVAREIHRLSQRAAGPFVPVNVGAIPETLLESELFGHEKGAFTGADARRAGLFELATGGTLFLDELGEMPPSMQVKLLRVLQDRTVTRLGGGRPIPVDVRIVAATNRDLEARVRDGLFREDLYFRINVIRIKLPPLRERKADIPALAGLFLARFARESGKDIFEFTPEALRALLVYRFPGNVRELENIVERAVILCESTTIGIDDLLMESSLLGGRESLPERNEVSSSPAGGIAVNAPGVDALTDSDQVAFSKVSIREAERRAVIAALARNGGHRERTAAELGISRRTLLNKMKEFGLLPRE